MKRLLLLLLAVCSLHADPGEIHAREVWKSGENLTFSGTAKEDVFLSGMELTLDAVFEGDLWAFGLRRILFSGQARDDVRLAALEMLKIDGTVDGSLRAAAWGGNIVVTTNTVVRGEAMLIASRHATVNGIFEGNLLLQGANISLAAEVHGDLTLIGNEVVLLPGTHVRGNLLDRSPNGVTVPEGVVIDGEVIRRGAEKTEMETYLQQLRWTILGIQFFTAFVTGLFLVRLLPRFTARSVEVVVQHRGPSGMVGFIGILLMGLLGWLLLSSGVGSGVGILLLTVCGILFYTGKIISALALGALLMRCNRPCGFGRVSLGLLLGLFVLYGAFNLPFIGGAVYLLASAWGMGAMLLCIRHSQRLPRIDNPPPPFSPTETSEPL